MVLRVHDFGRLTWFGTVEQKHRGLNMPLSLLQPERFTISCLQDPLQEECQLLRQPICQNVSCTSIMHTAARIHRLHVY
jgi:hypothetical protein